MGIGNNVLDDSITTARIGIGQPIIKGALFRIFGLVLQIAPLFVAEGFTVRDEELQVAGIWSINVWIVNLVNDAVAQGKPNPAARVIRRPDALFGAARPARFR